jgi:hypothetical protein
MTIVVLAFQSLLKQSFGVVLLAGRLSRPSPRCQGRAARGRFASLDTEATARGMAAIEEDGEEQGMAINAGRTAFAVPLACH